ncbi:MAG: hypothetical protein IT233_02775 [Bacteroidia bacterium]|nr:hypothetical protein [Bacteroidia bacterium]
MYPGRYFSTIVSFLFFSATLFSQFNQSLDHRTIQFQELGKDLHCNIRPYTYHDTASKRQIEMQIPVNWSAGYELSEQTLLYNGGSGLRGFLSLPGQKVSVSFTGYVIPPSSSPSFQDTLMKYSGYFPGAGRAFHDGGSKYSSEYLEGYVSWSPGQVFNFQAGKGKHFWGDGYRSLWLSDVSAAYPYLRISANVWKIKYAVLYAMHSDQSTGTGMKEDFRRKFGVFHLLSWNATPKWNFSFFENVIWQGKDTNRVRSFDVNYLNPVVFYRPVEYSLGSSDNSMIGFSLRHKTCNSFHWYAQAMLDEFYLKEIRADMSELISPDDTLDSGWWANKYGLQIGWKFFDLAKIKGLYLNQELNLVRPFTYSHGSVQQNYGHAGISLAHPLGSNFVEFVNRVRYEIISQKFGIEAFVNRAITGKDSAGKNLGGDIFQSYASRDREYGNFLLQGEREDILNAGVLFYYFNFPIKGVVIETGIRYRKQDRAGYHRENLWFFLCFKTELRNIYSDY